MKFFFFIYIYIFFIFLFFSFDSVDRDFKQDLRDFDALQEEYSQLERELKHLEHLKPEAIDSSTPSSSPKSVTSYAELEEEQSRLAKELESMQQNESSSILSDDEAEYDRLQRELRDLEARRSMLNRSPTSQNSSRSASPVSTITVLQNENAALRRKLADVESSQQSKVRDMQLVIDRLNYELEQSQIDLTDSRALLQAAENQLFSGQIRRHSLDTSHSRLCLVFRASLIIDRISLSGGCSPFARASQASDIRTRCAQGQT